MQSIQPREQRRALGGPLARWNLVEAGPGNGALAEAVLASLPLLARRTVRLHFVETSPVLREVQRERMGDRATWHETMEEALAACGGRAIAWASELLDALAHATGWDMWRSLRDAGERTAPSAERVMALTATSLLG